MDAAEMVVLDKYLTSRSLDTKRISTAVPSNDEHTIHCPTVFDLGFRVELGVGVGKFVNSINPFGADSASAAMHQEPAEVRWDRSKR